MMKRMAAAAVASLGLVGALVATAPAASAATRNGSCESGELCLYQKVGQGGAVLDVKRSIRNYGTGSGCTTFVGSTVCVKNHAASVWNRTGKPVFVFYNSDFGGRYDRIPTNTKVNLNDNVRNDNASHIIGNAELRFPLNTNQAHIKNRSPHWCWNSKTNCHHDYNAADIFAATGTAVVSPVNGTVKTVNPRSSGVGSTVTVKDKFGRLWYLAHMHHNPAPVVSEGQQVSKGQRIGTVGTSAHALGTSPHLHIDMRVGVNSRVGCSASECAGYGFVNNQPLLRTAFLKRP
ncbi:peptidoglycan DD-metalloendopeptidase family protein [Phycicoccus sp. CSK15P-2]|uniref:peptidoglycan DD-metalloendopeptidase family protein n=1 Tax=Phycicoccus sp. CSK15P-2 TaxID=2807627 RepID=UPI00195042D9|nr:peptidoglycan DD-metalloendopeptidase family protein [Phycicoccus sp. CSK15P-2]MBM6404991.1 peptidoglycan DD-metalloendopeptidase family protein [Phycicoccus sp. CSK15P-2]